MVDKAAVKLYKAGKEFKEKGDEEKFKKHIKNVRFIKKHSADDDAYEPAYERTSNWHTWLIAILVGGAIAIAVILSIL